MPGKATAEAITTQEKNGRETTGRATATVRETKTVEIQLDNCTAGNYLRQTNTQNGITPAGIK